MIKRSIYATPKQKAVRWKVTKPAYHVTDDGSYLEGNKTTAYMTETPGDFLNAVVHNGENPAKVVGFVIGGVMTHVVEDFYVKGKLHREHGPAKIRRRLSTKDALNSVVTYEWFYNGHSLDDILLSIFQCNPELAENPAVVDFSKTMVDWQSMKYDEIYRSYFSFVNAVGLRGIKEAAE